ncbi:RICIN domain-containing protein [Actinoplanes sp. NPDC051861]|uniref:RICIN domain-containing protein n=1 Tax=Actinoplanes sp. NPDC051861 TaxID=3155170 RepID=UPI0034267E7A
MRFKFAVIAAFLLAATGFAPAAAATAAPPTPSLAADGFYKIVNDRTQKCVDVPSASHASGVFLQQWTCHGGDNQRWTPIDERDAFFLLISKHSPQLCLHVRDSTIVDQSTCDFADPAYRWQWRVANDSGDLVLGSKLPGQLCLYLDPNTVRDGAGLRAKPCSNTHPANHWNPVF